MSSILIHPSELAYAFSYSRTEEVIGWGDTPIKCPDGLHPDLWYAEGLKRLQEADRVIDSDGETQTFNDDITGAVLALADPTIVLMAERRAGDGLRRMTAHGRGSDFIGLTHHQSGYFEMTRYEEMPFAAAAIAAYAGADPKAPASECKFETRTELFQKLHAYATSDRKPPAESALVRLGLSEEDAQSVISAMAEPKASGMVTVFYCAQNTAQDAEAYSVLTNDKNETWALYQQGEDDGPMMLERSSVAGLGARVVVNIAARMASAA